MVNDSEDRPDPDELLKSMSPSSQEGPEFRIFFGMSAGVGKTFAMLKEAQIYKSEGRDVVIGWLEDHGRQETEREAKDLENLGHKKVEHKGLEFLEMDIDEVLKRRPEIVLVDELAHTNVPGSRHTKRYLDVFELLDAGISVWSTVNIQHLESLADTVESYTGAKVKERIPDAVFDRATDIQLVDVSPEKLRKRMASGKIYLDEASRRAAESFFKLENLAGLRELALRQAAALAGKQVTRLRKIKGDLPTNLGENKILVAISSSPNSEFLIRWTRRLAFVLKASWTCAWVETGRALSTSDQERIVYYLSFARNLGAKVTTLQGDDVAKSVIDFAREEGISILVVGKSGISLRKKPFGSSVTDEILRHSGEIAVMAVQEAKQLMHPRKSAKGHHARSPLTHYVFALGIILGVTALNWTLVEQLGYWSASILYLASISLMGLAFDLMVLLVAAASSALIWNFLFIPPRFTFIISKPEDLLMLCLYFLLAFTSSWAMSRLKSNERMLKMRQKRMAGLSDFAQALTGTRGIEEIVKATNDKIDEAFNTKAYFFLMDQENHVQLTDVLKSNFELNEIEQSAAWYCFHQGKPSGKFTTTLSANRFHFLPLQTARKTLGVFALDAQDLTSPTPDLEDYLSILIKTASLAIERELMVEATQNSKLLVESERLSSLLLSSISHELRTPLTVIQGSAGALQDSETFGQVETRNSLIQTILDSSAKLNAVVENILSINRIESGHLKLTKTRFPIAELVADAIEKSHKALAPRLIEFENRDEDPMIQGDEVLLMQCLFNIFANISNYTSFETRVRIGLQVRGDKLSLSVEDDGPGLNPIDLKRVFEKFYRGSDAKAPGTGLGLSIVRSIVELHGGELIAEAVNPHGFRIILILPIARGAE